MSLPGEGEGGGYSICFFLQGRQFKGKQQNLRQIIQLDATPMGKRMTGRVYQDTTSPETDVSLLHSLFLSVMGVVSSELFFF